MDAAEILEAKAETQISDRLSALEKETGVQLVVATTPSLNGFSIEEYSLYLANDWGIGDAKRNDGLLLLVAPNERKVRIEVGIGLEALVTDDEALLIIEQRILPQFTSGDYDLGVIGAVDSLVEEVTPLPMKDAA